MDPHRLTGPAASDADDADDWDNDDFVIPSLSVEESDLGDWEASRASDPQPPPKPTKDTENIYLGPHGAPPSRGKKPEDTLATTGYRDKNSKAREADQKAFGSGRNSRGGETLGTSTATMAPTMPRTPSRDQLDLVPRSQ